MNDNQARLIKSDITNHAAGGGRFAEQMVKTNLS